MPVSTRSQLNEVQNDSSSKNSTKRKESIAERGKGVQMRDFHHGLKEKMEALTLLFEKQHKQAAQVRKNSDLIEERRNSTLPSSDLVSPIKKKLPMPLVPSCTVTHVSSNYTSLPVISRGSILSRHTAPDDAKENIAVASNRVLGFSTGLKKTRTNSTVNRTLPQQLSEAKRSHELDSDKDGKARIMVFVRLRPMSMKEKEEGSRCCVKIVNMSDIYLTEFLTENDYLRLKRVRGRHFTFDASFPDSTTQQEVYSTTTADVVEAVLQGKNGSVFCYGATGAGKTYTMLGTMENPGVMVLAIKDVFAKIRQRSYDGNHVVHLSYLEVYNDTVRDLLSPGRPLVLREDKLGIVAAGLTQYRAYSTDEVMALLQRGNLNRTTEPTRANETSSRSHAILQVVAEYRFRDPSSMHIVNRVGKLSLIDLAGSERALATDQRTLRSLEGANINKSLLALSSCINALVEGKKHIPYRNSKLTQLLKDSLGGSCNTVMIANISPSNLSFGETQNTLHWADRAKEIRTKACEMNEELQPVFASNADQSNLLLELQKENRELRVQLANQMQKLKSEEAVKELKQTVKALEREITKMRKEHALELKQRDELICVLSGKREVSSEPSTLKNNTKLPSTRFRSPALAATKKRSYCDITNANSPSVQSNGRKIRSHAAADSVAAPSMLLQPGFARRKLEPFKQTD